MREDYRYLYTWSCGGNFVGTSGSVSGCVNAYTMHEMPETGSTIWSSQYTGEAAVGV